MPMRDRSFRELFPLLHAGSIEPPFPASLGGSQLAARQTYLGEF